MKTMSRGFLGIAALALLALTACEPASEPASEDEARPSQGESACTIESADVPVLVHFYAPDVSPESTMSDVLSGVHEDFGDALEIVEIDAEACPALAESHGVEILPSVVLVRQGQPDVQVMGWVSREHLDTWLAVHGLTM